MKGLDSVAEDFKNLVTEQELQHGSQFFRLVWKLLGQLSTYSRIPFYINNASINKVKFLKFERSLFLSSSDFRLHRCLLFHILSENRAHEPFI